jgi:hypothetical protein
MPYTFILEDWIFILMEWSGESYPPDQGKSLICYQPKLVTLHAVKFAKLGKIESGNVVSLELVVNEFCELLGHAIHSEC